MSIRKTQKTCELCGTTYFSTNVKFCSEACCYKSKEKRPCVLCGKTIVGFGNNPSPVVNNGRCCDECNQNVVIPTRIKVVQNFTMKEIL